ncbi:MAG TPA: hypothetical protein VMB91_01620 [Solirubrobacteraceae bacterium]|nr:hypothetical protein [Solirubrobacteraceae bacterium]
MSRVPPCLALLAAAALLGACGKANPSASTTAHPRAPSSGDRARARALVRAVNLTAAEVPGFSVSDKRKEHESPAERRLKAKLNECVHPIAQTPLAEASSPEFKREAGIASASVQSEVTVAANRAVAARELAKARSSRTRNCVSHYVELLVHSQSHPGARFGKVSLVQRIPPAPGTDGSFAWRISVPVTAHGLTLALYFDIFAFVSGANEVTLFVSTVPIPPPAGIESHLFALLLAKAKAAEGGHAPGGSEPNPNITSS